MSRAASETGRFLLRRGAQGIVTCFILSVVVYLGAQVLPGNPGRAVLGPTADQVAVDAFNASVGYDRPVVVRYLEWIGGIFTGDLGVSYVYGLPVSELIGPAFGRSLLLGLVAILLCVPLALLGGVIAALNRDKLPDRAITIGGMSLSAVPEFVTGIALLLVFGVWLRVLPITASAGAAGGVSLPGLVLPAVTLALGIFGYIARVARAGTVVALDADFTRTARLKGITPARVLFSHVLRNGLQPAVVVTATQAGYMLAGLVVIERLYNYQGLGLLILQSAQSKDFPVLQTAILLVGVVYIVFAIVADYLLTRMDPAVGKAVVT